MMLRSALIAGFMLNASLCAAADLTVATFNTESDEDTQPAKVAESIGKIGAFDILVVQEVESTQALKTYSDAVATTLGGRWRYVISESGFHTDRAPDFLGIIYPTETFRQLATTEVHAIRSRPDGTPYGHPDWSLRGALALRLQHISTGFEFQIVTIHLKCCDEPAIRKHQAELLAKEIIRSGVPTILLGDTNIPIDPAENGASGMNTDAFKSLTTGANLSWIKPMNPIKTQCDPRFNSMLDQVYVPVTVAAMSKAEIKFPEDAYCDLDAQGYSDHRPIVATISDLLHGEAVIASETVAISGANDDPENMEYMAQRNGRPDDSVRR